MKIIVTGARGLVGSAVTTHCRAQGDTVAALGHDRLDITDMSAVETAFAEENPDAVINCAAYTDVDGAESHQDLCYSVNREGVRNLARLSNETSSAFLTISTDFVFDGTKSGFYSETDTARPLSVYGKAKLDGERAAGSEYEQSIVVRTGWIFGTGGTNFLSVLKNLLTAGQTVSAINDSFGTPTYAFDLAVRLREVVELNEAGLFHVTNAGEGASYHGFALETARLLGIGHQIVKEVSASSLERPAARPENSRLACVNAANYGLSPLPDWRDALARHIG